MVNLRKIVHLKNTKKLIIINSDKIKNHYRYPLEKTPLNVILDKDFLISKIINLKADETYPFYYVYNFDYENIFVKVRSTGKLLKSKLNLIIY